MAGFAQEALSVISFISAGHKKHPAWISLTGRDALQGREGIYPPNPPPSGGGVLPSSSLPVFELPPVLVPPPELFVVEPLF